MTTTTNLCAICEDATTLVRVFKFYGYIYMCPTCEKCGECDRCDAGLSCRSMEDER